MQCFFMRTTKSPIRLRVCAGWFEPSLGAHVSRHAFSRCSFYKYLEGCRKSYCPWLIILRCPDEETLHPWLPKTWPVKILIRLRICEDWSELLLGARRLYITGAQIHCGHWIWSASQEKGPYAICGQRRPWSACAYAQADLGLRCPLTERTDM